MHGDLQHWCGLQRCSILYKRETFSVLWKRIPCLYSVLGILCRRSRWRSRGTDFGSDGNTTSDSLSSNGNRSFGLWNIFQLTFSLRKLLMQAKPTRIHNSGCLMFGPHDGMLYFTMGDGGPFFDPHQTAQDLTKWLGKLLRIDVEGSSAEKPYRIPSDNPFVNRAGARPEIYAYGFRNPWRFTL